MAAEHLAEAIAPPVGSLALREIPFTIDADFDLGEAAAPWCRAQGADVVVRRGAAPLSLPCPESRGVAWQHAAGRTLILAPCGLRFLIEGGSTVRYAHNGGVSLADLRLFFIGTALSALAAQRGLLPLAASAVADGQDVHALVGGPVAGKSTLAAALAVRGYPFFTDSLLIVDPRGLDRGVRCYGCDSLKLWPGTLSLANCEGLGVRVRETSEYHKRHAEPRQRTARVSGCLRTVFWLDSWLGTSKESGASSERRSTHMQRLSGNGRKAEALVENALHSRPITTAIVGRWQLFQWIMALGRRVEVLRFIRPMLPESFEAGVNGVAKLLSAAESDAVRRPAP